jgi:hypothetical protein
MKPSYIHWLNQHHLHGALQQSHETGKPVLLDFHDPMCAGCTRLEQDTYSDPTVVKMVTDHTIPLRVVTVEPDWTTAEIINCYISISTLTIQLLTREGTVCHYWRGAPRHTVLSAKQIAHSSRRVYLEAPGYLPPTLFCIQMLIGLGKMALKYEQFEEALQLFDQALEKYNADNDSIMEINYWRSRVKSKICAT